MLKFRNFARFLFKLNTNEFTLLYLQVHIMFKILYLVLEIIFLLQPRSKQYDVLVYF